MQTKSHTISDQPIVIHAGPGVPRIKTNDLKKGDWVVLANGWLAEVWDNKKGNTRMCDVYGFEHEAGSVYSHDIVAKVRVRWYDDSDVTKPEYTGTVALIEHTKAQTKLREEVNSYGTMLHND